MSASVSGRLRKRRPVKRPIPSDARNRSSITAGRLPCDGTSRIAGDEKYIPVYSDRLVAYA
eukprot:2399803-Rhodomonas_salina.1